MATITRYAKPQIIEEIAAGQYNYRWDFSAKEFPAGIGDDTDQAYKLADLVPGCQIVQAHLHLTTAFEDLSDAAFNSVTLDFGDTDSATRYFSGVQINRNGSEVIDSYLDPTGDYIYTAADKVLLVNFNAMSAKSLSNLDKGALYLEFTLLNHSAAAKNLSVNSTGTS